MTDLPDPLPISPLAGPLDVTVALPGSKSLTNRALVCAALADGTSTLPGVLDADDTWAMVDGLRALDISIAVDWPAARAVVEGCAGRPGGDVALIDVRSSGTTGRFLLPVSALGDGVRRVDGANRMRERPMGDALEAVRSLGAQVHEVGAPGHLPVEVVGGSLVGGDVTVRGDASSQFVSGLLLAGPAMPDGLRVTVAGALVSRPYVAMTEAVMARFGVDVERPDDGTWSVAPQSYRATTYQIEPDASAASYCFAAAAIVGGRVTVDQLHTGSLQGDVGFVDVLERMGATVTRGPTSITVEGSGRLEGIEVDLADTSDTAQTLAAVAVFADGPTRVTGIGFIRGKETDRVRAVVTELRRLGIEADEEPDGFVVRPGPIRPATVHTYDDHRMAMAFALIGLRVPGIQIADPACVGKTFPGYWQVLNRLAGGAGSGAIVGEP